METFNHQPIPREPLRLRGHTLLCLQGFRGEGYSPGFVENLTAIHRRLLEYPDQPVEIIAGPDAVCAACPHHAPSGCTLNHDLSEVEMHAQDRHVLALLHFRVGEIVTWREILDRIRTSLTGDQLPGICGQCRWLPLGYCREGVERLRSADHVVPSPLLSPRMIRSNTPS
ncbi:MAG TPA: DUF1284 domain-containing protein [Nitrospiraceae bacterium]|nr:DUF1284 domain-containing protein [Nitrospiraceae bacterium]